MCVRRVAGVSFPVIHHFLSGHIPPAERSRAIGAVFCGNQFGTIVAFYVCPLLAASSYGWQGSFYLVRWPVCDGVRRACAAALTPRGVAVPDAVRIRRVRVGDGVGRHRT
jgi:hypothetical protein